MRRDILEIDTSLAATAPTQPALADVEAIRLLLSGGSVVDWHKAAFRNRDEVDQLLRLFLLDPDDPIDQQRLRYLFLEATTYVEEYLGLRVPSKIKGVHDVRDIFLWASDTRGFRRNQVLSCMILKLMHVMQHLEAADLHLRAPISEHLLLDLAHARVAEAAHRARTAGIALVAFYGSKKTRMSVITKLLCKRDDVATKVFDKLRYRVVVPEAGDIAPMLAWLVREVCPFNQILPGQSHNNLLDPDDLIAALPPDDRDQIQPLADDPVRVDTAKNEFSGRTYRMINFVVDLPVKLPEASRAGVSPVTHGRVVFVTTEFQVLDAETAAANEDGENAHHRYKERQEERVRRRLTRGAFEPT